MHCLGLLQSPEEEEGTTPIDKLRFSLLCCFKAPSN